MSAILDQHRANFTSNPDDNRSFEALEEHYFMGGEWEELVAIYQQRLNALSLQDDPTSAVRLMFRLAQVLEERCQEPERAIPVYWRVAKLEPQFRPALRQLRVIHANREQWDVVLQIAEMESQIEMAPHEVATFQTELGEIWNNRLDDPNEARGCYEKALEASPRHAGALAGLARVYESLEQHQEAASTWQRLADRLRGPDRSPVLVSIGNLMAGPLGNPEHAGEFYEQALRDDPRNAEAVDALCNATMALERWPRLAELFEIRFDLAAGAQRRTAIALEAGRLNLEKLDDTQAARNWFERARELSGDDATIFDALADLERRTGNRPALRAALDRVVDLAGSAAPVSALIESADLHAHEGNHEKAHEMLRSAYERSPENPLVVEALSESLARLGRSAELVEILEKRVSLCSDDEESRVAMLAEMGRIHMRDLDDPDAAVQCLDRAFQLDPAASDVASLLEQLLRKREDWNALHSLLTRAAEDAPEAQRAGFCASLGDLRIEHLDDAEGAQRAYESALGLDDRCTAAHQGLEQIALRSGSDEALLGAYEREAQICTDRARLATLVWAMVPLLEARERNEDAVTWIDKLLSLQPDDRRALETLARLRQELGDEDGLSNVLQRLDPLLTSEEQAENRRKLAALYMVAGRKSDAIACYQSAVQSDPNDLDSLRILKGLYHEARDHEALARTLRRLSDLLPDAEAVTYLDELSVLLETQLGDTEGAIVVLWRLVHLPESERPRDIDPRLESLLERTGRLEELAQQLLERRRGLSDHDPEAEVLDLRRAQLLLESLGQYEEAASLFATVHRRSPHNEVAIRGLEHALRAGNDADGLVALLAERADRESDPNQCAAMLLERAILLEDSLGEFDEAREALVELAGQTDAPAVAEEAGVRLERIFTRCGDWEALRDRLEARLARCRDEDARLALHDELARLYRDRLNDSEGCIRHFESVGKLAPQCAGNWHSLAILYEELDRNDDLLRVIRAELDTEPDRERECVLHGRAARLCQKLGRPDGEAGRHYERLNELEPGHSEASEFLIDFYEREGRFDAMVALLRSRLAGTVVSNANPAQRTRRVSLQLRIADIEATSLDDPRSAIATLETALSESGPNLTIIAPLADLHQRSGDRAKLVDLCRQAGDICSDRDERASWLLRAGDGLRELGEPRKATEAYRQVLQVRPDDQDAQSALLALYRELDEAGPLCELLEREVERRSGPPRVALQMERAGLLADRLDRPADALAVLQQVLAADAGNRPAFERAVALALQLGRTEETVALIDVGLGRAVDSGERVSLLELSADLYARDLEQPDRAIALYREALAIEPGRRSPRSKMREIFESQSRWNDVLDCLFLEAAGAEVEERVQIFERGVEIARRELHPDAALPWLERLHAEKPEEIEILSRIADVHRQAGRPEALLRVLDEQLELTLAPARQRDIHVDRARILERDLSAPGRALLALESARAVAPRDSVVLEGLDRLYDALARHRERADVIEARILCHEGSPETLAELHHTVASLWSAQLASPERATPHLLHAIALAGSQQTDVVTLLRELAENLRASGDRDAWTRAAEAELERLVDRNRPGDRSRRHQLHWELAECYQRVLSRGVAAERHLLALLDLNAEVANDPEEAQRCQPNRATIEAALLDHLRSDRNFVELERRLSRTLEESDGTAALWLELARLYDERLHRPAKALEAYLQVLERDATSLAAIRGMRHCAEILGDWTHVADALEREIGQRGQAGVGDERALQRRLGDVCWRRLPGPEGLRRAAAAYTTALELRDPDLETLRALQQVREQQESHREALILYRREIALLGDDEAERRHDVWLRIAEINRDHTNDQDEAIEAYEQADAAHELCADRLRDWAELHREAGDRPSFVAIFERWSNAEDAAPTCADHLELAENLHQIGRTDAALARVERAIEADRGNAGAWELAADLQEERGAAEDAASSLTEAAELRGAGRAAAHLLRASRLLETHQGDRARTLLRRAADHDPGEPRVHAQLARVCEALESWEEAVEAAGTALDLATDGERLAESVRMETALIGGRSAWKLERLEAAANFFAAVIAIAPEHVEALEAQGEVLFQCGDISSARHVLEKRLELPGDNPNLAHHLAVVATGYELEESHDEALAHFKRALEHAPRSNEAHEGVVRIHETTGDIESAIEVLKRWIDLQEDAVKRASQLFHVAQLEVGMDRLAPAEDHLRCATRDNPKLTAAWSLLADQLEKQERHEDALAVANDALDVIDDDAQDQRARLALIRGRTLESQGDAAMAAEAFAEVIANDPCCDDAALSRARLLRNLGAFQEAADTLQGFLAVHPDPERRSLAKTHYKLGGLLAGPLERIEDAVACYERALDLDPEFTKAREPLANLLTHLPDRRRDAAAQHRALLAEDPLRESSIRGLLQIARDRGDDEAERTGLAILRALGAASPDEFSQAPGHLPLCCASERPFEDASWEKIRKLAKQTAQEISEALASVASASRGDTAPNETRSEGPAFGPYRAFWDTMRGAEAELSVPGFESLDDDEIARVIRQVAALALDFDMEDADPDMARSLDRSIGRWTRRKLRKILDTLDARDLAALDWSAWREGLRLAAARVALDRCDGDLRSALITLSAEPGSDAIDELSDTTNIADRTRGSQLARGLLASVLARWSAGIGD